MVYLFNTRLLRVYLVLGIVAALKVRRIQPGGMACQAAETVCAKVLGPEKEFGVSKEWRRPVGGRVEWREAEL